MVAMPHLFDPITLRGLTLANRVLVSPMCEYSSDEGFANDWHLVHLGSRAAGGAALTMTEATAGTAEGRISPADVGVWSDRHVGPIARADWQSRSTRSVPARCARAEPSGYARPAAAVDAPG